MLFQITNNQLVKLIKLLKVIFMSLYEQVQSLKQQGLTPKEIAEQLGYPLWLIKALYDLQL